MANLCNRPLLVVESRQQADELARCLAEVGIPSRLRHTIHPRSARITRSYLWVPAEDYAAARECVARALEAQIAAPV